MFDRVRIKYRSRERINHDYSFFIRLSFLWYMITLGFIAFIINPDTREVTFQAMGLSLFTTSWAEGIVIIQRIAMLSIIYQIMVKYPFEYGFKNLYRKSLQENAELSVLISGFKEGYSKVMATLVIKDIIVIFCSLFFIVPGIIKRYSYRFVPYLLKEYPEKTTMELLKLSEQMTKGIRMELFKLDLSFLGWQLADLFTFGLSSLYYVPYYHLTDAGVYEAVRRNYY